MVAARASTGTGPANSAWALFGWIAPYFRAERKHLGQVLALSMAAIALSLAQPFLTKELIDAGIVAGDPGALLRAGAGMLAITLFSPIVGFLTRRCYIQASAGILHGMREDLFMHVLHLKPAALGHFRQGDLLTRLEGDLSELQRFAIDSALSAINSVVIIVGTVLILGSMNPVLTALLVLVFLMNSRFLARLKPRLAELSGKAREAGAGLSSFLVERTAAVKHVQSYCAQSRELVTLRRIHAELKDRTLELQAVGYAAGAIPNLVVAIGMVVLFVGGGWLIVDSREMTLGVLVAFTTYAQRISGPLQSLSGLFVGWQRARVSLIRVFELMRCPGDPPALALGARSAPDVAWGEIRAENLYFRFPGRSRHVLAGISFHIPAGRKVLVRAPSGAGKSTLIDILHGHLVPSAGAISIGGVDLAEMDLQVLRRHLVVVSQEAVIFSGTLAENLRYGRPEASEDELAWAAGIAGLGQFIRREAHGLAAEVGPRGSHLSGGERQRLALARAILLRPAVLVVDEGTSGLDLDLEIQVLEAIDMALPGSTRIIVSHRPLAADGFDQVLDLGLPAGSGAIHV